MGGCCQRYAVTLAFAAVTVHPVGALTERCQVEAHGQNTVGRNVDSSRNADASVPVSELEDVKTRVGASVGIPTHADQRVIVLAVGATVQP